MTAIAVTAARVGLVDPIKAKVKSYVAAETITKGQAVYVVAASGKAGVADANASGKHQFAGIALNGGGLGQAIDVCQDGELYGFTLSGNYYSAAYLSDTAGGLDDAPGTAEVVAGRVMPLADKDLTKVLYIFSQPEADWP